MRDLRREREGRSPSTRPLGRGGQGEDKNKNKKSLK
jgi:hypothetical protein